MLDSLTKPKMSRLNYFLNYFFFNDGFLIFFSPVQTTSSSSPLFTTCFLPLTHFVSTFTPEPENESSFLTHVFKNIRFTYRQRENTVQLCILVPWNYNQLTCMVQCYPNRLLLVQRDWKKTSKTGSSCMQKLRCNSVQQLHCNCIQQLHCNIMQQLHCNCNCSWN